MAAARVAVDRSDLWLPGSVVAFAGAGWLVFLVTVAPPPSAAGAAGLAFEMAASPWWPWNLFVLMLAVASGLLSLFLVIAFGEVAILLGLSEPGARTLPRTVPRAMAVLLAAALPVLALLLVLVGAVGPLLVNAVEGGRLLAVAWPFLILLGVLVVVVQAFGAAGLRRRGAGSLRAIRRHGHRLIPQAAITFVLFVLGQLLTWTILGVLWEPLAQRLTAGGLASLSTAFLLLGFVWIWLVLVVLAGVGQAWTSAWWSAELGSEDQP
jgi:hypothetical protein